ncbi:MAG TPA: outer membrane protein assembly factor BamD [Candidatus Binataceae bacterium]|nr:outer membrane protein assembly factor BamD [Candidatus Binataceae bacterium]
MRISSILIGACAMVAAAFLGGCADESGNINQLNQNEFALRGMIASDRQEMDSLRAELKRTQDQVAELQHANAGGEAGNASADVSARVSRLESEMNAVQAAMPATASAAPGAETPPVPGVPPVASAPGAPPPPSTASVAGGPPGASAASAAGTEPAPTWPQDLDKEIAASQDSKDPGAKVYRKGLDAMKTGNYPAAIIQFAKVQHNFPKSPLSEPAQYFTANAFYENSKYEQAVLQFNDLTMRFPSSRYLCESLLREGQSFVRLNDRIDARLTLQKLAGNSNCATESVAANNMLKDLGSD